MLVRRCPIMAANGEEQVAVAGRYAEGLGAAGPRRSAPRHCTELRHRITRRWLGRGRPERHRCASRGSLRRGRNLGQLADRVSGGAARRVEDRFSDRRHPLRRAAATTRRSLRCSAARHRRECDLAPVPRSRCPSPTPGSASDRASPWRSATTTSRSGGDGSIAHSPRPGGSRSNTCRGPWRVRPGFSSTGRVRASRRSSRSGQSRHLRIHQGRRPTHLRLLSPSPFLSIPTQRYPDALPSPRQPGSQRPCDSRCPAPASACPYGAAPAGAHAPRPLSPKPTRGTPNSATERRRLTRVGRARTASLCSTAELCFVRTVGLLTGRRVPVAFVVGVAGHDEGRLVHVHVHHCS
jgi:hypothetical protein